MRRADRDAVTQTFYDVIIIGGGVTGSATAREAGLRGLSALLVEKGDFASGTSSRSTKLIHGGLRYLETYQFKLVAESVRERERALKVAPHITAVRPFLYLLYEGYPETKSRLNLGLTFYDVASGQWRKRRHRMLSAQQVLEREPHLNPAGLTGAGLYVDVLTDDARFTINLAEGAAEAGADLLNHATVTDLIVEHGHARGITIHDELTGEDYEAHGRQILNATGPWTDRTRALEHAPSEHHLRPTKGVHIAVRKADFPLNTAVFLRSPDDNRVVWPIPSLYEDLVYIGTTDTDWSGDPDDVYPDESDIEYLLNVANLTIPTAHLDESHIVGCWAGLRPMVAPAEGVSESNTSREHEITAGPTGMLTIAGGKLTTSRLMARQFVDAAATALNADVRKRDTNKIPLPGAAIKEIPAIETDARAAGVPDAVIQAWIQRYGSNARKVLYRWTRSEESHRDMGVRALTVAEIEYGVEEEMVNGVSDLLVRRTAIFFWDAAGGLREVEPIADVLTGLLGWTPARRQAEIDEYRTLVEKHMRWSHPASV